MRILDEKAIEHIALGASLLGTGGGGDPHIGKLMALDAIRKYGPVTLLSADELPDDALIVPSAMMGAPVVIIEKLPNGQEFIHAFKGLEGVLGKKVYATIPIEAGGGELHDPHCRGGSAGNSPGGCRRNGPGLSGTADGYLSSG